MIRDIYLIPIMNISNKVALSNLQETWENSCLLENDQLEKLQEDKFIYGVVPKDCPNQEVLLDVVSRLQRLRLYYNLKFVNLFCHEAIKDIDISKEV